MPLEPGSELGTFGDVESGSPSGLLAEYNDEAEDRAGHHRHRPGSPVFTLLLRVFRHSSAGVFEAPVQEATEEEDTRSRLRSPFEEIDCRRATESAATRLGGGGAREECEAKRQQGDSADNQCSYLFGGRIIHSILKTGEPCCGRRPNPCDW